MKLLNVVLVMILAFGIIPTLIFAYQAEAKMGVQVAKVHYENKDIADELEKLKFNISSNGNLINQISELTKVIQNQAEETRYLKAQVESLHQEVCRGISLIPVSLKKATEPDQAKTAAIKTINDKLNVVAEKAATKEDLERLKDSVLRVIEEVQSVKTLEKKEEPTVPQVVLPQLSEEFPKK